MISGVSITWVYQNCHFGLRSWNVFFGNNRFDAMNDMLKSRNIDIANLQETNNKLDRIAEASGYSSVNTWKQPHDWCGYNFHNSDWGLELSSFWEEMFESAKQTLVVLCLFLCLKAV